MKRLRKEIDNVLGQRSEVKNEDLPNMPYVSCVIKESLRLWPPAGGGSRRINTDDFKINGLHIPNGTMIMVKAFLIKRN